MEFTIQREALLKPLQDVCGVVERRQTLPILSHVLLKLDNQRLSLTATDLEVEMVAYTSLDTQANGDVTLPARKFLDICRALPEGVDIKISINQDKAVIKAGRSRFSLATLPSDDFPNVGEIAEGQTLEIKQRDLKDLIEKTGFAMAQQDVRYYLNGLLLELSGKGIRAVATDGHRLAMCDEDIALNTSQVHQAIVPRKGVLELARLLEENDETARVQIGSNHIMVSLPTLTFTSKLIDGKFPDYQRVIPDKCDKQVTADRESFRQALGRASILSNEKYRGVRLQLQNNLLRILANNPEQEEAEEELEVAYDGDELEVGFNVGYVLDAITAVDTNKVVLLLSDPNSSCMIKADGSERCRYVVMPMRI
jgi:DNA polymerase-3 subunit beta